MIDDDTKEKDDDVLDIPEDALPEADVVDEEDPLEEDLPEEEDEEEEEEDDFI